MKKYHEEIVEIANTTFVLQSDDAEIGEIACVLKNDGTKLYAQVISFNGERVVLQAMGSTAGLCTGDRATFLKQRMKVSVGKNLLGRVLSASGEPRDDGPIVIGDDLEIGTPPVNPVVRTVPYKMIETNIPMIDLFNTLIVSQKIPIFSVAGEPYNELLMRIGNQASADVVLIGIMAARQDDLYAFVENAKRMGSLERTAIFAHMATDYPVECLLVPDMVLTAAEKFAESGERVLVLLTDMTAFADAIKEISISMDQVPSNRGFPGSLYSDLASRYEKAVEFAQSGSVTIIAVTTMPGDDVTHPVPDNTGYITEGQFYLRNGRIEPFGSLSRLKQNHISTGSRKDHATIMNTMIRLYSEALKARDLYNMGFRLSQHDENLLKYGDLFEEKMMDLNVNISLSDALDLGWNILAMCFEPDELGIKKELLDEYWDYGDPNGYG